MIARQITIAMLCAAAVLPSARAQDVSPQVIACQGEATKRYLADFHPVGKPKRSSDGMPVVVITVQNERPMFVKYVDECMERLNSNTPR